MKRILLLVTFILGLFPGLNEEGISLIAFNDAYAQIYTDEFGEEWTLDQLFEAALADSGWDDPPEFGPGDYGYLEGMTNMMDIPYDGGVAHFEFEYERDELGYLTGGGSWEFTGYTGDDPIPQEEEYHDPGYGWGGDWIWEDPEEDYDPAEDPFYYDDDYDDYYVGAAPPVENPGTPPPGNKEPKPVPCNSEESENATKVNAVYNGIKNNTNFKDLLAKSINPATNVNESAISITKIGAMYGDLNYVNGNSPDNVLLPTSDPIHTVVAGAHTHPLGKNEGPSPKDIYHLIQGKAGNDNFNTNFMFAANGKQFAIVIDNKAAALKFLADFPPSTNLNGVQWGGAPSDGNNLYGRYLSYINLLKNEGYPKEMWEEYGLVYLMSDPKYNMGVKLLQNINGTFKELNVNLYRDVNGNAHAGIKICQ